MPTPTSPVPAPARILQMATASWMSAAVSAMATLGVADALAAGPRPVDEIASAVGAHAPTLHRLLRACADLELLDELDDRVFALTDLGRSLRSDVPGSMRGFATWVGLPADRCTWSELVTSIRTGRSAFEGVHGAPVWDYMRDHGDVAEVFDRAMTEASSGLIAPVVAAFDFSGFGTVVDVAGGHGALLAAILAENPGVRGVLFDQPEVITGAGAPLRAAGVQDRCELVGGSFFDAVPAGGDAYLLSNVIHDWDDERSVQILARCRDVLPEHGRVLLVEAVMPEKAEPALTVKLMDLNMLVLCDGRQRTASEYAVLFERAGLELARVVPGGLHSVVEAVPARRA